MSYREQVGLDWSLCKWAGPWADEISTPNTDFESAIAADAVHNRINETARGIGIKARLSFSKELDQLGVYPNNFASVPVSLRERVMKLCDWYLAPENYI